MYTKNELLIEIANITGLDEHDCELAYFVFFGDANTVDIETANRELNTL